MLQRQPSNPSLRELLNQLVTSLIHPFDSPKHSASVGCCQSEITAEVANAKLSQFEKTYVSFPEFIDINSNETGTRRKLYNNKDQSQQWHQRSGGDTLTTSY